MLGKAKENDCQDGNTRDEPLGTTFLGVDRLLASGVKDINVSVAHWVDKQEDQPGGESADNGSGKGDE